MQNLLLNKNRIIFFVFILLLISNVYAYSKINVSQSNLSNGERLIDNSDNIFWRCASNASETANESIGPTPENICDDKSLELSSNYSLNRTENDSKQDKTLSWILVIVIIITAIVLLFRYKNKK